LISVFFEREPAIKDYGDNLIHTLEVLEVSKRGDFKGIVLNMSVIYVSPIILSF